MIETRALTMEEYDRYEEEKEALQGKGYSEEKINRKLAMFVCKEVYGMDLNAKESTVNACVKVFIETIEKTSEQQKEEEKN